MAFTSQGEQNLDLARNYPTSSPITDARLLQALISAFPYPISNLTYSKILAYPAHSTNVLFTGLVSGSGMNQNYPTSAAGTLKVKEYLQKNYGMTYAQAMNLITSFNSKAYYWSFVYLAPKSFQDYIIKNHIDNIDRIEEEWRQIGEAANSNWATLNTIAAAVAIVITGAYLASPTIDQEFTKQLDKAEEQVRSQVQTQVENVANDTVKNALDEIASDIGLPIVEQMTKEVAPIESAANSQDDFKKNLIYAGSGLAVLLSLLF